MVNLPFGKSANCGFEHDKNTKFSNISIPINVFLLDILILTRFLTNFAHGLRILLPD